MRRRCAVALPEVARGVAGVAAEELAEVGGLAHPDHYYGAARFGAPIHALAAVRDQISAQGAGHG